MRANKNHGYFLVRRLHTLLGILPIAIFVVYYLYINSYALGGESAYNSYIESRIAMPLTWLFVFLFFGLPLLFHSVLGIIIFYTGKNNFLDYNYFQNWLYFFQRVTGVIALIFILLHVWSAHISPALADKKFLFADMQKMFDPAWIKWFYIIGILALMFHVTNGLVNALQTWGVTVSKRSQKFARTAGLVTCGMLSLWGLAILWSFS